MLTTTSHRKSTPHPTASIPASTPAAPPKAPTPPPTVSTHDNESKTPKGSTQIPIKITTSLVGKTLQKPKAAKPTVDQSKKV